MTEVILIAHGIFLNSELSWEAVTVKRQGRMITIDLDWLDVRRFAFSKTNGLEIPGILLVRLPVLANQAHPVRVFQ
jgi:hypothetical protein